MPAHKRKPNYNGATTMQELLDVVCDYYGDPVDDRKEEDPGHVSLHDVADRFNITVTDLYKQQLITLTEFEKMMGKKRFNELLGEYVAKPPGKLALVPESDPRPPVDLNNAPDQEFAVLTDSGEE